MISYKKSIRILKNSKIKINDEIIKTNDCLYRISSQNIKSKVNNPLGDNAAFDGYAINSKDTKYLSKKNLNFLRF